MARKSGERTYQFVDDLVAITSDELQRGAGLPADRAREIATRAAHRMIAQYARTYMYVPAALEIQRGLAQRDEKIWEKYKAGSPTARRFTVAMLQELATEHHLTTVQIRAICNVMRDREIKRMQQRLPGFELEEGA